MKTAFERQLYKVYTPYVLIPYILLIVLSYFFWDKPIARWMAHHSLVSKSDVAHWVTNMGLGWMYIFGLPLLALVFYYLSAYKKLHQTIFVWASVCCCGLVADLFKIILSRARPKLFIEHGLYGFQWLQLNAKYWSFPSGHSSVVFGFALALGIVCDRYRFVFLIYALIVALSRVVVLAHFLSDIMAASLLSIVVVLYVSERFKTIKLFKNNLESKS